MKTEFTEDVMTSVLVPAGTLRRELFRIRVPSGSEFEMTDFGNYVADLGSWSVVYWNVEIDGSPLRGYSPIYDQYGSQVELRKVARRYAVARNELVIYASNPDTIDRVIGTTFKGEYHALR